MQFFQRASGKSAGNVCVHAENPLHAANPNSVSITSWHDPATWCSTGFFRLFHGWLCKDHFWQEQNSIPRPARKPQVRARYLTDDEFVQHIVSSERNLIAAARASGDLKVVTYGRKDPVKFSFIYWLGPEGKVTE